MTTKVHGGAMSQEMWSSLRTYIDPSLYLDYGVKYPFLAYMLQQGVLPVRDWKWSHWTKGMIPRFTLINYGAGYNTTDTTFTVDDGYVFRVNDLIVCFRTMEQFRVTSVTSTTITVGRSLGTVAAAALVDNDVLIRVSPAARHGEKPTQFATLDEVEMVHYLQEFTKTVQTNYELRGVQIHGGDRRELEQVEKYLELFEDISNQILVGDGGVLTSGGGGGTSSNEVGTQASEAHPLYMTEGLRALASTHVLDNHSGSSRATITENNFNASLLEDLFWTNQGATIPLFVSTNIVSAINLWGRAKLDYGPSDTIQGIHCNKYQADGGTVELIHEPNLKDYATNVGWNGCMFAVHPGKAFLASIPEQASSPDLREDVVKDGTRQWVDEWLWTLGLFVENEKYIYWGEGISGGA